MGEICSIATCPVFSSTTTLGADRDEDEAKSCDLDVSALASRRVLLFRGRNHFILRILMQELERDRDQDIIQ
jgi:hypothetical protein